MGFELEGQAGATPEFEIRKKYIVIITEKLNELSGLFYTNPIAYKDAMSEFLDKTIGEIGTDFLNLERKNSSHDTVD